MELAPGARLRLCDLEGSGRIVRFWMTLPVLGQGSILKDAVLRMFWDGEDQPSVETPLGDFFGASFGKPVHLVSARLVVTGGAYLCRFEMPFNNGAVIEIENGSASTLRNLFFQIGYYEEPPRARRPTLHAQFRRECPTEPGRPFVVLQARGKGWLAGVRMDFQTRAWWLKPPWRDVVLPRGFGLGVLEGWETITVDAATEPLIGTGAEDYFSGGFYFKGAPFCTPTHGCTRRSFVSGRVSAYRLHEDDPIPFDESIDMVMDHGLENTMEADYSSVAYWYQDEPHAPFPPLSPAPARRPSLPWTNAVQLVICAAVLAISMATAVWIVVR